MRLVKGKGTEKTGACWMTALHFYTREDRSWSDDAPWACVSNAVKRLCIRLNDWLESDEERGRIIGPHLFAPLGTSAGKDDERARAFLCADYAVRKFAPIWLEIAGRKDLADRLRAVPQIVDAKTALFGCDEARAVRAVAYAAYADAAYSAASASASAYAAGSAYAASAYAASASAYAAYDDAAYSASSASASASADAAYSAAASAAASARLKTSGRRDEMIALRVQLILDCCAVGERKEVASVCTRDEVLERCQ